MPDHQMPRHVWVMEGRGDGGGREAEDKSGGRPGPERAERVGQTDAKRGGVQAAQRDKQAQPLVAVSRHRRSGWGEWAERAASTRGDRSLPHAKDGGGGADRGEQALLQGPLPTARCVVAARPSRRSEGAGNVPKTARGLAGMEESDSHWCISTCGPCPLHDWDAL